MVLWMYISMKTAMLFIWSADTRNYLEHVASIIIEWTQQEEAKYQARLLAQELERTASAEKKDSNPTADAKSASRAGRNKSPSKKEDRSISLYLYMSSLYV